MSIESILAALNQFTCDLIEITGGEPLLQEETVDLARQLIDQRKHVLVETNGTKNIDRLPDGVIRIMDIKCPDSGESDKMDWENLNRLRPSDNVKFVISSRNDFDWSARIVADLRLQSKVDVLFSPGYGVLEPSQLARWILDASLPVRMQLQLHKYIWPPNQRGV